jgi:MarR family transcriptional regulator, transcriptional regulator for hemolysin
MPAPRQEPIGRALASTQKVVTRAFEQELAAAGGSQPTWLILLALKQQAWRTQQEIAATVGIEGATLTHHLDKLEKTGLIERKRDPANRRAVIVELTGAGEAMFLKLAQAAMSFDKRLRKGLSEADADAFRKTLERLRANVGAE